jgi:dienelactone hydrolase
MKIQFVTIFLFILALAVFKKEEDIKMSMEVKERKTSISDYLVSRVNELEALIPKQFTSNVDLEKYQQMVKKRLAQNLGIEDFLSRPSRTIVEKVYRKDLINDCVLERIDYQFDWNFYIPCHVWRPAEVKGKLPAVLLFTDGGKCNYDINKMMQEWARRGMIVLQPDYPLTEEMRDPYIGAETAGYNAGLPLIGLGTFELIRGIDYLSARPDVDSKRIALLGLNRATIETILATALDDRVQAVAIQNLTSYHAWAKHIEEQVVVNLLNTPRHFVPGILKYADLPQVCAAIAPRILAIFGHDGKEAYPEEGYEAIVNVCQKAYSLLAAENRFSTNKDTYPYLPTATWLQKRMSEDYVPSSQKIEVNMNSERGYEQSDFYRANGMDVEPALAQSNELIHSPWSYLKYRAAIAASKLPNEFASVSAWEEFRESYLLAHSQFMGQENLYKVEHAPMDSAVLKVEKEYSIPGIGGPVVREDIVYHFDQDFYIPALVFRPKEVNGKLPAAVLTPGWFQPKDDVTFLKLSVALANEGFVAICMDRIENLGANPNFINGFGLALGSSLEGLSGARIVRALDYLVTREDVDAERIGIAGLCSGSITMWSGVPIEPRFKAIVHVSGTTNEESWSMDFNYAGDMETAFPGILKHGDIQHIYASYAPKPFLFLTNRTDNWWPQPGLRRCVEVTSKVYKLYGARDKFDYRLFNATHTVDEPFRKWIVYWFKKWLQGSNTPQPPEVGKILE